MPNIGPLEIAIVLIILLVIFGPKRLPGLGKSLGTGMREFKETITGSDKDKKDEDGPSQLTQASSEQAAAAVPPAAEAPATPAEDEPTRTSTGA